MLPAPVSAPSLGRLVRLLVSRAVTTRKEKKGGKRERKEKKGGKEEERTEDGKKYEELGSKGGPEK